MFSIKLYKICISLLYAISFIEAYPNSLKNTAIINHFCKNNFWKYLSNLQEVRYGQKTYYSKSINYIADTSTSNDKVRSATLLLSCLYAQDLRQIFYMVNDYQNICQIILEKKCNPYLCTINLLTVIKKITILATIIKESLISLDAVYTMPPNQTIEDYILYDFLSRLQEVEKTVANKPPSQDNTRDCEIILLNIKNVFKSKIEDMDEEIQGKRKRECKFITVNLHPMSQDLKTVDNVEIDFYYFKDLNKKFDIEFRKILIQKYFNLGFYFNTNIKMVHLPTPGKDLYDKENELNKSEFMKKEIGKKSPTEVEQLLKFLKQVLSLK
ncbi:uncharacterized protein LOC126907570 isoform X2 [Daktulosphaira vitifoliae]|uniref:uncharacterized protein LOC126907570 isoform X2 n=1 Tax=Daktulosphaira vitifoliae TaxID=58002 RepID=UPI0021A9AD64|nr:uncharacterized protein LOC126907570 isoform X2 [Daktulosphaira vitifoliae]